MNGSIRARFVKGFRANALGQVTVAVIQLASVPILLHYWGARMYGEWLILFAIPAYLAMTDLGFSQSAANDMAARLARGERKEALAVFQSLSALVFCTVGIGLLLVSGLAGLLLSHQSLPTGAMTTLEVRLVLWFLATEVLVKLGQGVGHAGFRANGDYPVIATLYSITLLLQYVGMWCIAALGMGPIYAAAAFPIVRIAIALIEALMLMHRHSWLRFGTEHARFAVLRKLFGPAVANVATPFALTLSNQGMILVVGATLGTTAVVTFSVLRTLTRILVQAVLGITNALEADFAAAYGTGNTELLRKLYLNSLRAGIWLTFGGTIVLLSYGDWLLTYWTNGKVKMDVALYCWLLLTAAASVMWQNGLALLRASNRHLRAALVSVVTASFGVGLSWLLLRVTHHLEFAGTSVFVMDLIFAVFALRAAATLCGVGPIASVLQALDPLPLIRLIYAPRHAG